MVKKRGIVWNYFEKKVNGSHVIAFCKFCDQSYTQNATRMERHMERCPKCPDEIRLQFIQVAVNKKSKACILGTRLDGWVKQDGTIEGNVTDTEIEDFDNWGYRNQNCVEGGSRNTSQNVELLQNDDQNWVGEADLQSGETEDTKTEWLTTQENSESPSAAGSQEQSRATHQRKPYGPRRLTQWPMLSMRPPAHSPLQSKIYQEQLLERRALRRVAELELRRKTMEFERFQWEYERDKAHSEVRWAHDTRMMQLKEERERQLIDQSRARGGPQIISCATLPGS